MAYKRHLIAKTKNLFDVSKIIPTNNIIVESEVITCLQYGMSVGQVKILCPSLQVGDKVKILLKGTYTSNKDVGYQGCFIYLDTVYVSGSIITVTQKILDGTLYLYNAANIEAATQYPDSKGIYYNITITKDLNQSETIPYGYLPSHKSKLKVANVCQVVNPIVLSEIKNGVTFTNNNDGTITVNGTATRLTEFKLQNANFLKDHVYLLKGCPSGGMAGTYMFDTGANIGNDIGNGAISKPTLFGERYVSICVWGGTVCNNLVFKPQLFDLTEMYGAGHEPTTVAEFRAKFPNELYPYAPKCWLTSYKHNLIAMTKNLLSYSETTAEFSEAEWENTNPRDLSEGVWYVATSANNYTIKHTVTDYKIERNLLYINAAQAAYGLSRAFKCNPGEVYTLLVRGNGNIQLGVGFFDMSGNYLSYANKTASSLSFTTPTNCKWFWVNFAASQDNSKIYFRDIQLEKGSSPTDYVPNGYL